VTTVRPRSTARRFALAAAALGIAMALSGCTTTADSLAEQFRQGDGKNYVAGDGTVTEIRAADRGDPVEFTGTLESGDVTSSTDYLGQVVVLNFWYAGCAPCRAEAPDLQGMWEKYQDDGVVFLGVNVRDQAGTALAFSDTYGITYPSVLDVNDGAVQLAFAGTVAPNAVPTTLVLDKQGRVASRVLGRIQDASILDTLISSTLAEEE
jgi:peroxiredoxin